MIVLVMVVMVYLCCVGYGASDGLVVVVMVCLCSVGYGASDGCGGGCDTVFM